MNYLKAKTNVNNKLKKAVIDQLDTNSLISVYNNGAACGYNGFTYYAETIKFYQDNKKLILNMIHEQHLDIGYDSMCHMISSFNCLKPYKTSDVELYLLGYDKDNNSIPNALAWYALEEIARDYVENYRESI
jgi:hypothetical protein